MSEEPNEEFRKLRSEGGRKIRKERRKEVEKSVRQTARSKNKTRAARRKEGLNLEEEGKS